jgi:hypothetical protein
MHTKIEQNIRENGALRSKEAETFDKHKSLALKICQNHLKADANIIYTSKNALHLK